tara:strand:+ start:247 stop:420 length:174 start_codon:yes stop_codon:yes gene_type:complete
MAGNKYDTPFEKLIPDSYKLEWTGLYGDRVSLTGDARQIVRYIMAQQLYNGPTTKIK